MKEIQQTKQESILYLSEKLYGSPLSLQYAIYVAINKIETGINNQKVLDWYNKLEEIYNSKF